MIEINQDPVKPNPKPGTFNSIPKQCNHINTGKNKFMQVVCLDCDKVIGYVN